jgi:hypothetical protein
MKKLMFAAAAVAALLSAPAALAADRCNAASATDWTAAGLTVEAFASGATCDKAVGVIVFRDAEGTAQVWEAYPTEQNAALTGRTTAAETEAALKEWIDQSSSMFKTTADLPEWKDGTDIPMTGEFPFYVEEGLDRENYARIRKLAAPIFCYVSGMESMSCLYKDSDSGGLIFKVGAQSFPG